MIVGVLAVMLKALLALALVRSVYASHSSYLQLTEGTTPQNWAQLDLLHSIHALAL